MTPDQLIQKIKDDASEWLEMSEDPANFLAGILAHKIIRLEEYIQYLEKRINHATHFEK
jgi:flagellar biosynthesis chaperone FliJ